MNTIEENRHQLFSLQHSYCASGSFTGTVEVMRSCSHGLSFDLLVLANLEAMLGTISAEFEVGIILAKIKGTSKYRYTLFQPSRGRLSDETLALIRVRILDAFEAVADEATRPGAVLDREVPLSASDFSAVLGQIEGGTVITAAAHRRT